HYWQDPIHGTIFHSVAAQHNAFDESFLYYLPTKQASLPYPFPVASDSSVLRSPVSTLDISQLPPHPPIDDLFLLNG
ncbi:hypothetical protein, partial [Klebsiella pneumoniae]|uniref:hypothetical protein n=1 Tax=Klebsiella pneumoniae TaxID=573 RepID=UPI003EE300A4